jgi:hypothetical protein
MTLTRYLYNKEHVEYSFFLSLLKRDREQAKFWIYELYHSGFKQECFALVWKLYYQLYAGFFVNLEELLKRQTLEWMEDNSRDWTIGTIVENMARREPCIEFRRVFTKGRSAPPGLDAYVTKILEDDTIDPEQVFSEFTQKYNCFRTKGKNAYESFCDTIAKIPMLPKREAYAARLFTGVFLLDSGNGFDRKVYVILGKDDVAKYKNKPFVQGKSWKILRRERKYTADMPPDSAETSFDETWLSRAYGSPIWRQRIEKYGGKLVDGEIQFGSEEQEEQFDLWYNLEPDEQPAGSMSCNRTFKSWTDISSKYSCEPFNEWASTYTLSL